MMLQKKSKYHNSKIYVDGIKFDSKDEAAYYEYLLALKAKGEIQNFELQPKYILIPAFKKYGKAHRAMTYTPDFLVYLNDGNTKLIDVKGMATQQGEMRKKLFDFLYPDIELEWVCRSSKYGNEAGWIEYDELKRRRRQAKNERKIDL